MYVRMQIPRPHFQRNWADLGLGLGNQNSHSGLPLGWMAVVWQPSLPCLNGCALDCHLSTCLLLASGNRYLSFWKGFLLCLFFLHFYLKWLINYIKCFLSFSQCNHFKFFFKCTEAMIFDLQQPVMQKGVCIWEKGAVSYFRWGPTMF